MTAPTGPISPGVKRALIWPIPKSNSSSTLRPPGPAADWIDRPSDQGAIVLSDDERQGIVADELVQVFGGVGVCRLSLRRGPERQHRLDVGELTSPYAARHPPMI